MDTSRGPLPLRAWCVVLFGLGTGCTESDDTAALAGPPNAWVVVSPATAIATRTATATFTATASVPGAAVWFSSDTLIARIIDADSSSGHVTVEARAVGTASVCARFAGGLVGCGSLSVRNP